METEHEFLECLGDLIVGGAIIEIQEFVGILEWVALAREEGHFGIGEKLYHPKLDSFRI
jgi:hypothetical protein